LPFLKADIAANTVSTVADRTFDFSIGQSCPYIGNGNNEIAGNRGVQARRMGDRATDASDLSEILLLL
jgi:hypothetical protein